PRRQQLSGKRSNRLSAEPLPTDLHVTLLPAAGPRLLSTYLAAVADGRADPPDLVAVPVRADELEQERPELDLFLPVGSATAIAGLPDDAAAAFVQGMLLGSYAFTLKSGPEGKRGAEVSLLTEHPAGHAATVDRAVAMAGAVALARDLTNTPSAQKSPAWLAG